MKPIALTPRALASLLALSLSLPSPAGACPEPFDSAVHPEPPSASLRTGFDSTQGRLVEGGRPAQDERSRRALRVMNPVDAGLEEDILSALNSPAGLEESLEEATEALKHALSVNVMQERLWEEFLSQAEKALTAIESTPYRALFSPPSNVHFVTSTLRQLQDQLQALQKNRQREAMFRFRRALGKFDAEWLGALSAYRKSLPVATVPPRVQSLKVPKPKKQTGFTSAPEESADRSTAALERAKIRRLINQLLDPNNEVRRAARQALAKQGDKAVPALLPALVDPNWKMRNAAVRALGHLGPEANQAVPRLREILIRDTKTHVREIVIWALVRIGPSALAAVPELLKARVYDNSGKVRVEAGRVLYQGFGPGVVPQLQKALNDEDQNIRQAASEILSRFEQPATPQGTPPDAEGFQPRHPGSTPKRGSSVEGLLSILLVALLGTPKYEKKKPSDRPAAGPSAELRTGLEERATVELGQGDAAAFAREATVTSVRVVIGPTAFRQVPGLRRAVEELSKAGLDDRFILLPDGNLPEEELQKRLINLAVEAFAVPDLSLVAYAGLEDQAMQRFGAMARLAGVPLEWRQPTTLRPLVRQILLAIGVREEKATQKAVDRFLSFAGLEEEA